MTTAQSAIDTSSLHGQQRTSVRHPCAHTKRLDTKPGQTESNGHAGNMHGIRSPHIYILPTACAQREAHHSQGSQAQAYIFVDEICQARLRS